jgi:hypothetical protein
MSKTSPLFVFASLVEESLLKIHVAPFFKVTDIKLKIAPKFLPTNPEVLSFGESTPQIKQNKKGLKLLKINSIPHK